MKNSIVAFLVGVLFSLGLGVSGMTQPQKVVGFLDIFGAWDPSLIFVMVGAIAVHAVAYKLIRKRKAPILAGAFQVPERKDITKSLILGSILFGIGWGLAGYCPGPAVTSLATFEIRPALFVASMIVGMFLFRVVNRSGKL